MLGLSIDIEWGMEELLCVQGVVTITVSLRVEEVMGKKGSRYITPPASLSLWPSVKAVW